MDAWHVDLSREAAVAVGSLADDERRVVEQAISRLSAGPNPTGVPQAYSLRGEPEMHVLRAGGRFRILFTVREGGSIVVTDVVNHDSVREYFTRVAR